MPARRATVLLAVLAALLAPLALVAAASAAGTVTVTVVGHGSVTGSGIDCTETGGDCSEYYADESYQECDPDLKPPCHTVTIQPTEELTAGPDQDGFVLDGWTGCDAVSTRVCTLSDLAADATVTARFRDVQPPSVNLAAPAEGFVHGTISLAATASDNSGSVARVVWLVDGVPVATDSSAPWSATLDTTSWADGPALVEARAYDPSGNVGPFSRSVTIDNTAPTLAATGPGGGTAFRIGSTQTWMLDASDATSGLASLDCSVVPAGDPAAFAPCDSPDSHRVSGLVEGSWVFTARATDNAGLTTTIASRAFRIDATAPQTRITRGPAKVVRTHQRAVRVSFALAADEKGSRFQCRLDRYAWKRCTPTTRLRVGTGRHLLLVRATDPVGNTDASPAAWRWRVQRLR